MDRAELQALQAPLKARYRDDPGAAFVTLHAQGALGEEQIACSVANGRALAEAAGHLVQRQHLRLALDIELIDAGFQAAAHLFARLAHAREDDLAGRNAGGERLGQFAARHHIGAGAQPRQSFQHRQIAIRLDRKSHQRSGRQRAREHLVVPLQGGGGIAIERCADVFSQPVQPHLFGAQRAVFVLKMMHASPGIL